MRIAATIAEVFHINLHEYMSTSVLSTRETQRNMYTSAVKDIMSYRTT